MAFFLFFDDPAYFRKGFPQTKETLYHIFPDRKQNIVLNCEIARRPCRLPLSVAAGWFLKKQADGVVLKDPASQIARIPEQAGARAALTMWQMFLPFILTGNVQADEAESASSSSTALRIPSRIKGFEKTLAAPNFMASSR